MIRRKFEQIKNCKKPKLSKSWKCTKLCHFGKNFFPQPVIEYRDRQVCAKGTPMTMCEQIKHAIELAGIREVVDKYTVEGYNVGKYKAPGSTELHNMYLCMYTQCTVYWTDFHNLKT